MKDVDSNAQGFQEAEDTLKSVEEEYMKKWSKEMKVDLREMLNKNVLLINWPIIWKSRRMRRKKRKQINKVMAMQRCSETSKNMVRI